MSFNFGRFLATALAQLRMTFRRRITLFWSLVFPMILMTLLGLLFGRSVNAGDIVVAQPVTAAAPKAMVTALEQTKGLTVKTSPDAATAIKKVKDGDEDAALVFTPKAATGRSPPGSTRRTRRPTQAGILKGIVFGAADRVSIAATGGPPALRFQALSVDSASLSYIDFLLPGHRRALDHDLGGDRPRRPSSSTGASAASCAGSS